MKKFLIPLITPFLLTAIPACKPKEAPVKEPAQETVTPAEGTAESAPQAPPAPQPSASTAERAAKLGFAKHLPADIQSLVSIHNGSGAIERIKQSKFVSILGEITNNPMLGDDDIIEELDVEQDATEPEAEVEEEVADPTRIFAREITLAFGKDTNQQLANLVTLSNRLNYHRIRAAIATLAQSVEKGEFDESALAETMFGADSIQALIKDPQAGPTLLAAMNMPPTYAAFLSTPENRETDTMTVSQAFGMLAMFGEMVTETEVEVAGSTFKGYKILGEAVAKSMEDSKQAALEVMDEATFNQLSSIVAKKNLVILTGTVGDYVVVFLGSSEEDLKLAPSVEESIASGNALAFADPYLSKDLFTVIHGNNDLVSTLISVGGGFGVIADGVRDGLGSTTALGDTREIVALLQVVADKESAYLKMMQPSATGSVSYFEDGFKLESFGGIDAGAIEWERENTLGSLGQGDNIFLFADLSTSAQFEKTVADYYEAILESVYAIGMKVAEKGGQVEELQPFNQGIAMFDTTFRSELVTMWKAFTVDMEEGLGRERAWIVDLDGSVPPIPGIPQPVVDKAKFPRVSVVAPVQDRTKLASSWKTIHESATRTLGKVSEMMGQNIPMQKPMNSESSGITTWFFSFPFFNDDFLPSVTLSDQWFVAGTSKSHALDLIKQAAKSESKSKGAVMHIKFSALQSYLQDMMPIIKENAEAWNLSEKDLSEMARLPDIFSEMDSLDVHTRKEKGTIQTSIHFKTR